MAVFGQLLAFRIILPNFEIVLTFLLLSENKTKLSMIFKIITEIGQTVPKILYFKVEKSSKNCDFFSILFIFLVNLKLGLKKLIITNKKL